MSIYRLIQDSDRYDSLLVANRDDGSIFDQFGESPLLPSWRPVVVNLFSVGQSGDFPSLRRDVPVFSERAWQALRPLIDSHVEALLLAGTTDPYFAIHVTDIADCLDHSRSEIKRLPSGGVMRVLDYKFNLECLGDRSIFKLPETVIQEVLVSEKFKMVVKRNRLKGLIFRKIA